MGYWFCLFSSAASPSFLPRSLSCLARRLPSLEWCEYKPFPVLTQASVFSVDSPAGAVVDAVAGVVAGVVGGAVAAGEAGNAAADAEADVDVGEDEVGVEGEGECVQQSEK